MMSCCHLNCYVARCPSSRSTIDSCSARNYRRSPESRPLASSLSCRAQSAACLCWHVGVLRWSGAIGTRSMTDDAEDDDLFSKPSLDPPDAAGSGLLSQLDFLFFLIDSRKLIKIWKLDLSWCMRRRALSETVKPSCRRRLGQGIDTLHDLNYSGTFVLGSIDWPHCSTSEGLLCAGWLTRFCIRTM